MNESAVYRYPRYYAIGYRWNTEVECNFIESCLGLPDSPEALGGGSARPRPARILDIGCGAGRHLLELARRGHEMSGVDLRPEMVAYVHEEARKAGLDVDVSVGDLRALAVDGPYDAAFCFMDTFRFLLTNDEIRDHLRSVADRLAPGGLYLLDFWVPAQWDRVGYEVHQWEQTEGDTTVRVFYLQHPDSVDPITQTFDDELVFEVREDGQTQEIRGGPTRTRLLLPQEFLGLVEGSGVFTPVSTHGEFDLAKPFDRSSLSWRMISVLKKR